MTTNRLYVLSSTLTLDRIRRAYSRNIPSDPIVSGISMLYMQGRIAFLDITLGIMSDIAFQTRLGRSGAVLAILDEEIVL